MHTSRTIRVAVGTFLVCTAAVLLLSVPGIASNETEYPDATIPAHGPDHGVNSSDFHRLWSDNVDEGELEPEDLESGTLSTEDGVKHTLARSTDIPFAQPPEAVEQWNRGDVNSFRSEGTDASIAPVDADLVSGEYIKDAFVDIAAIQPSTVLHATNETSTQYVRPDGDVLAVSDYRIEHPPEDTSGATRESWSIEDSSVESVSLEVDDRTIDTDDGHRSTLSYTNLTGTQTLWVEATIDAELKKTERRCTIWNSSTTSCDGRWLETEEYVQTSETANTSQSVSVTEMDSASGTQVEFEAPSDERGVVLGPNTEWSTITVDEDVEVRSNWWFYSGGNPSWNEVVRHTEDGSTQIESSVRPVQVHAFPSEEAAYVPTEIENGTRPLTIEQTWGEERAGPSLPSEIDLRPATEYTHADSIALSSTSLEQDALEEVTVDGIVRGQSTTISIDEQRTVRETNLSLSVTDSNATHAIVEATVTESASDDPVSSGRVEIGDVSQPVTDNGTATLAIHDPDLILSGEYVPQEWWRTDQPYTAAQATTTTPAELPSFHAIVQLVVVTILWFLPLCLVAYGFDYATGGELFGITRQS